MRISARCDYACRALLELSLHWPDKEPLQIQQISERQEIPIRYLVQILIQLKRIGFVVSSRGKQGGYNLLVTPKDLSLGNVMRGMGGPLLPITDSALKKESVFSKIWEETEGAIARVLDSTSFHDIRNSVASLDKVIAYDI